MQQLKIPLIILDALWMKLAARPPNPPPGPQNRLIPDWRERFVILMAWPSIFFRTAYWSAMMLEAMVIIALQYPTRALSPVVLDVLLPSRTAGASIRITPAFVLGNLCTTFGTLLRIRCYRTLGRFFTYELAIMKSHHLVTTGPYASIRHPSYTALIFTIFGAFLNVGPGSWIAASGILDTGVGRVLFYAWILCGVAVIFCLLLRAPLEDQLLRHQFGSEWDQWANRVGYRFIPGVY